MADEGGIVIPVQLPGGKEGVVTLDALTASVMKLAEASRHGKEAGAGLQESFEKGFIREAGAKVFDKMAEAVKEVPKALEEAIKSTIEYGDNLSTMASRANYSVEGFQQLDLAASKFGLSGTMLTRIVGNLGQTLVGQPEKLNRLGLSFAEIRAMSPEEQFATISERIKGLHDPIEQANVATQLFGNRFGRQVLPLLREGTEGLSESAKRLGYVMSTEDAQAMSKLGGLTKDYDAAVRGLKQNIALMVMDQLHLVDVLKFAGESVGAASNKVKEWRAALASADPLTKAAVQTVGYLAAGLAGVGGAALATIVGVTAAGFAWAKLVAIYKEALPVFTQTWGALTGAVPSFGSLATGAGEAALAVGVFVIAYKGMGEALDLMHEYAPGFASFFDNVVDHVTGATWAMKYFREEEEKAIKGTPEQKAALAGSNLRISMALSDPTKYGPKGKGGGVPQGPETEEMSKAHLDTAQKVLAAQDALNKAQAAYGTEAQKIVASHDAEVNALNREVENQKLQIELQRDKLGADVAGKKLADLTEYQKKQKEVIDTQTALQERDNRLSIQRSLNASMEEEVKAHNSVQAALNESLADYDKIQAAQALTVKQTEEEYASKLRGIELDRKGGKIGADQEAAQKAAAAETREAALTVASIKAQNEARDLGLKLLQQQAQAENELAGLAGQLASEQESGLTDLQKAGTERERAIEQANREFQLKAQAVAQEMLAGKAVTQEELIALGAADRRREMEIAIADAILKQKQALQTAAGQEEQMRKGVQEYVEGQQRGRAEQEALNALLKEAEANHGKIKLANGQEVEFTRQLAEQMLPGVVGQTDKWYSTLQGIAGLFGGAAGSILSGIASVGGMIGGLTDKLKGFAKEGISGFSGLGGAIKGIFADSKGGFSFSSILQGAGWVGQAASAVMGVVSTIKGLFSKPEYKKVMDDVGKSWGVSISEGLAKQIEATETKDKVGRQMAELLNIGDIMAESGKDPTTFAGKIQDLMNAIKLGAVPAKEGTQALGKAFTELAANADQAGRMVDATMLHMIQETKKYGNEMPKEMKDYIEAAHTLAAEGAKEIAEGMAAQFTSKEGGTDWAVSGKDAALFFGYGFQKEMEDKGIIAALDDMGDQLKDFYKKLVDSGDKEGAKMLAPWEHLRAALDANTEHGKQLRGTLETLGGMDKVFQGMAKAGDLTADGFAAMERSIFGTANALNESGIKGKDAMAAIYGPLKDVVAASQAYGFALDKNTQDLVDQAKAAGFAFPVDPAQAMLDVMVSIAKVLGADIPESAKRAGQAVQQLGDTAANVHLPGVPNYQPTTVGNLPPGASAAGGLGPVTLRRDTVIQAHEGEGVLILPKHLNMLSAAGGIGSRGDNWVGTATGAIQKTVGGSGMLQLVEGDISIKIEGGAKDDATMAKQIKALLQTNREFLKDEISKIVQGKLYGSASK